MANAAHIERISLRILCEVSSANTTFTGIHLQPNSGVLSLATYSDKLNQLGDIFEFYRCTSLTFHRFPHVGTASTTAYREHVAYFPGPTSAPSTVTSFYDAPWVNKTPYTQAGSNAAAIFGATTRFVDTVPKKVLTSTLTRWYKTKGTSYDDNLEDQGYFYLYVDNASTTVTLQFVVECTYEFKNFIGPAQTPAPLLVEEKENLQEDAKTTPRSETSTVMVTSNSAQYLKQALQVERRVPITRPPLS